MNKKGFTLIELLAVIAILAILVTIATVSLSASRNKSKNNEKDIIRQTIISSLETYRIDNSLDDNTTILISNLSSSFNFSYDGNKCSYGESSIKYVIKKNFDNSSSEEEVFCVKFYCNDELIINNYEDNSTYCN